MRTFIVVKGSGKGEKSELGWSKYFEWWEVVAESSKEG